MKQVKVRILDLKDTIIANQKKHREEYALAFEGYRKECLRVLEQEILKLKTGSLSPVEFREVPPENHIADYDTVLQMLDWTVDTEIILSYEEFLKYVKDDWSWKSHWFHSNSKYLTQ